MLSFLGLPNWGSSRKSSRREHLDDELNQNLPYSSTHSQTSHSSRSYKTSPSQISISAPIPRSNTSLAGFDNPYYSGSSQGNPNELWQFRPPTSSLTRLGATLSPESSSSASVGRVPLPNQTKSGYVAYHLPSPPLSDDGELPSSINDGPLPAVIRIETGTPSQPDSKRPRLEAPMMMRRTVSSPPTPTSPYHHSPVDSSSSSSEVTPTIPSGQTGKWTNLKLHTNHIYSQSTQSLPSSSFNNTPAHLRSVGMHSDPSLADPEKNADPFAYAYSYPLVKQLSPIAEQEYFSPDSLKRTKSLPPSVSGSRSGSGEDLRASALSGGSLTHSGSPIGSLTSEITRPSPIYASPFISRPLNRTASQTSSRTHVSATSTGPRQSLKSENAPIIPPLDLRPTFPGPYPNPSPTGLRPPGKPFANPMPSILGSTEGEDMDDEYAGTTDFTAESLHAESFVTAASDDELGRPSRRGHSNSPKDIELVDKDSLKVEFTRGGLETASVRSATSKTLPSASESFITRRWDRDVGLGPGVPTFRAKKQRITVTPAFWAFWVGFLCPVLWLIGGWHFTNFGEQPPRLTFWEFYFNSGYLKEMCCGGRNKKREMDHMKREGKKAVPPPALPRWVAEKQSSELGRARLNDPKRSLKGISFGYPFISRPVPARVEESFLRSLVERILNILGKPNRVFDHLYGIKLREVRGRPEGPRRMFDPWVQRCRYALCYAMLLLAIGLLVASTYLIVINTRKLQ